MGNAGSSGAPRERQKSGDTAPSSPSKEGQAFVFDKKIENKLNFQGLQEDEEPYFTKPAATYEHTRPRANTGLVSDCECYIKCHDNYLFSVSEGTPIPQSTRDTKTPTVFRWEGGGKEVCISGTFTNWQTIPMVKSHGDFVTIIDLPEGEHHYKFCVDGEWKNDPASKLVEDENGLKNNLITVKKSDFEVRCS